MMDCHILWNYQTLTEKGSLALSVPETRLDMKSIHPIQNGVNAFSCSAKTLMTLARGAAILCAQPARNAIAP